jgi:hypothetical protein
MGVFGKPKDTLDGMPRPRSDSYDPSYSPTLKQKSEHLMRLPVTSYNHGYSCDRRGNSTGVKSHFLPPIPGWEVKTCHYTHHTAHCFATDHPRGRIRQGSYPHDLRDSALSARPRPSLDPASTYHRSAGRKGRRSTGLEIFSPSRPLRHHGVRGWSAIPGARHYNHLYRDRQNFKTPLAS